MGIWNDLPMTAGCWKRLKAMGRIRKAVLFAVLCAAPGVVTGFLLHLARHRGHFEDAMELLVPPVLALVLLAVSLVVCGFQNYPPWSRLLWVIPLQAVLQVATLAVPISAMLVWTVMGLGGAGHCPGCEPFPAWLSIPLLFAAIGFWTGFFWDKPAPRNGPPADNPPSV